MKPSPSLPSRFSAGISQSSKISSEVSLARRPSLFSFLPGAKSLGALLHHEGRQPVRVSGPVGHGNNDRNVGVMAVGDEGLGAVQHPVLASPHRRAARAARIGPRTGFGQAPRSEELARGQLGNVLALLLFVAGDKDVVGTQRSVRRDGDSDRTIHARKLFDGGNVLDVAHARAAVLGGKDGAQQPQLAQFLHRRQRKLAGFVPLHDVGARSRARRTRAPSSSVAVVHPRAGNPRDPPPFATRSSPQSAEIRLAKPMIMAQQPAPKKSRHHGCL